ncbi:hypothetical protein PR001_g10257 [Phytophthora rubi]|uniref:Integrase catalytic domain-containing protein n=1 Tax=Phytophthora rubi TaxID=129364 RepID=A0A6A3MKE2_9STRA|nr:hypothetical protein PR001_g10257 [Phytophthora rubi]
MKTAAEGEADPTAKSAKRTPKTPVAGNLTTRRTVAETPAARRQQRPAKLICGGDGQPTTAAGPVVNEVAQAQAEQRARERAGQREHDPTLQMTDDEIISAQAKSSLVQRLVKAGENGGLKVEVRHGLALIATAEGKRVILPPSLWAHEAEHVAEFLMRHVVLKFGPFRELLTDGAPELTGKVIEKLFTMLQAQNPVPYRPQMIGLVERFHRTWKDCVAAYMATHYGEAITKMGRQLKSPNELLRETSVAESGEMTSYHRRLLQAMRSSHEIAERARARDQARQAKYYNLRTKQKRTLAPGDRVWMFRSPRGPTAYNLVHQRVGPMRVIEPAGYDNFLVEREDTDGDAERHFVHVSFLVTYYYPKTLLKQAAADIAEQVEHERDDEETASPVRATTAPINAATAVRGRKRGGTERDTTSSSSSSGPYGMQCESLPQTTSRDGSPLPSMIGFSRPTESWKLRWGKKACNGSVAQSGHTEAAAARIEWTDEEVHNKRRPMGAGYAGDEDESAGSDGGVP